MTKIREIFTNLITIYLFFWCIITAFAPYIGYELFMPFTFLELENTSFNYVRLLVLKSATITTMALFMINFWRHRRPLSAIAPVVVICYSLVFFELLSVVTLQQFTEYEANIYLIIFFITAGGLLHFKNIKNSESIFSR